MDEQAFKQRTQVAALRAIKLVEALPRNRTADESIYWIELIASAKLLPPHRVEPLAKELHEIAAMTVASIKTLRSRPIQNPKSKI